MSYSNFNTFKLFQNVGINSSGDYMVSMKPDDNNISFHSSNSIDYNNVDIMSIKNIINKKQNEDLNLSSLNGTTINPVITINNNHSDCRIMTNLNVSGNINLTNEGMIKTTGIGSFGSINCGGGTFFYINSGTPIAATNGGTGIDSFTTGDILYANSNNSLTKLNPEYNGQILTLSNGIPEWKWSMATNLYGGVLDINRLLKISLQMIFMLSAPRLDPV